jgi:ABC-type glycerol-3-phosphate transport system permease component
MAARSIPLQGQRTRNQVRARRFAVPTVIINAIIIIGVFFTIFPYLYMISGAFKTNSELYTLPISIWPPRPITKNFSDLFALFPFWRWYLNTLVLAVFQSALNVFLSSLAGFAFAKYDFRFRNTLFAIMLFTLMLPGQILLLPQFIEVANFGWYNTYAAVIVPGAVGAFGIFLMRQYATALPNELLDAARMDGATEFTIFWRVALPMLAPAVSVLAILAFNGAWNNFLWPLLVLSRESMFVLNLGLSTILGPYNFEYGVLLAGSTLASIPLVIVFLFFQRQLTAAVSSGAFKGA